MEVCTSGTRYLVPGYLYMDYMFLIPGTVPATGTFSYSGAYLVAPVLFEVRDVHGYATRGHDDDDDANDDERQWYVSGTTRYLVLPGACYLVPGTDNWYCWYWYRYYQDELFYLPVPGVPRNQMLYQILQQFQHLIKYFQKGLPFVNLYLLLELRQLIA